jgi:hypothetical protein
LAYETAGVSSDTRGSANLWYQVVRKFMVGAELCYANREMESGVEGNMKRLQFSARDDL